MRCVGIEQQPAATTALWYLQVRRTLLGDVEKDAGFLGGKSKELREQYEGMRSVVTSWQVSEFSDSINIVNPIYLLGKDTSEAIYLDNETMELALLQ